MFWNDPNLYGYKEIPPQAQMPVPPHILAQWQQIPRFVPPAPFYGVTPQMPIYNLPVNHPYFQTAMNPFLRPFDVPYLRPFEVNPFVARTLEMPYINQPMMRQFDLPFMRPFEVNPFVARTLDVNLPLHNLYRPIW